MESLSMHNWIWRAKKRFHSGILFARILWRMSTFCDSFRLYSLIRWKLFSIILKALHDELKVFTWTKMNGIESFRGTHFNFQFINGNYSTHEKLYFSLEIVFVNIYKEIMIMEWKLFQIHYVLTSLPRRDESYFNERWIFHFSLFHYLFNFSKI